MLINAKILRSFSSDRRSDLSRNPLRISGTILASRPQENATWVKVGERVFSFPYQPGYTPGSRVLIQMNPGQEPILQLASNTEALETASDLQPSQLGRLLELMDRQLNQSPSMEKQPSKLSEIQTLARQLFVLLQQSQGASRQVQELSVRLMQLLGNTQEEPLKMLAQQLQPILAQYTPQLESLDPQTWQQKPLGQLAQDTLNLLATNDFTLVEPTLQQISQQLAKQPATAEELPALAKILIPLQELSYWGVPKEINRQTLHQTLESVQQQLSIPIQSRQNLRPLATSSLVWAQPVSQNDLTRWNLTPLHSFSQTSSSTLQVSTLPNSPAQQFWTGLFHQPSESGSFLMQIQPQANQTGYALLPQPEAHLFSPEQVRYWTSETSNPAIPFTANMVDAMQWMESSGPLPLNQEIARQFAQNLHQLDLTNPIQSDLSAPHKDLLYRMLIARNGESLSPQERSGLLSYQPEMDLEQNLWANFSPELQKRCLELWSTEKPLDLKSLLKILQTVTTQDQQQTMPHARESTTTSPLTESNSFANHLTHSTSMLLSSSDRELIQTMQRQLQMTHWDQETRHPEDRQEVFYWHHQGELHKGRLQIRHRSGQGSAASSEQLEFTIQTTALHLGSVSVHVLRQKDQLHLQFQDSEGNSAEHVQQERETLSQELAEIGLSLGKLDYLFPPPPTAQPRTPSVPQDSQSFLDLRA